MRRGLLHTEPTGGSAKFGINVADKAIKNRMIMIMILTFSSSPLFNVGLTAAG